MPKASVGLTFSPGQEKEQLLGWSQKIATKAASNTR
jgi:hypothetical protein